MGIGNWFQDMTTVTIVVKVLLGLVVILGLVVLVAGLIFMLLVLIGEIKKMWRELKNERRIKETLHHPTTIDQL